MQNIVTLAATNKIAQLYAIGASPEVFTEVASASVKVFTEVASASLSRQRIIAATYRKRLAE